LTAHHTHPHARLRLLVEVTGFDGGAPLEPPESELVQLLADLAFQRSTRRRLILPHPQDPTTGTD
jgi:hypothetical protein